jgi:hypothetical protein
MNGKFLGKKYLIFSVSKLNFFTCSIYNYTTFVATKNGRKKISPSSFGAVVGSRSTSFGKPDQHQGEKPDPQEESLNSGVIRAQSSGGSMTMEA